MGAYLSQSDVVVIGRAFRERADKTRSDRFTGKPLVAGPSMHNFQAIGELEAAGGLIRADADQISEAIGALLGANNLGQAARAWVIANRGSTSFRLNQSWRHLLPIGVSGALLWRVPQLP